MGHNLVHELPHPSVHEAAVSRSVYIPGHAHPTKLLLLLFTCLALWCIFLL